VVIGGGPVPAGWLDGSALAGPVPPRPALGHDTVLALVHTSGTTGRPAIRAAPGGRPAVRGGRR
jgi:acyl-coenzyme A synthetase/AMP-(fatty) acid ligase